jgi:hypothetical protein
MSLMYKYNEWKKQRKKIIAKLSLRLLKYHTMKTYPVPNEAQRNEDVLGSGGIDSCILNLGTR